MQSEERHIRGLAAAILRKQTLSDTAIEAAVAAAKIAEVYAIKNAELATSPDTLITAAYRDYLVARANHATVIVEYVTAWGHQCGSGPALAYAQTCEYFELAAGIKNISCIEADTIVDVCRSVPGDIWRRATEMLRYVSMGSSCPLIQLYDTEFYIYFKTNGHTEKDARHIVKKHRGLLLPD